MYKIAAMLPLAERMRPQSLEDYIGQKHILGPDKVLNLSLIQKKIPSIIFWGPPGVGKTTLAHLIAKELNTAFFNLSAIDAGVKEVREMIAKAQSSTFFNRISPILFIDEIHRFNKGQQDALLAAVEKGVITLIGATTENPSFEINAALLSRCQVYILNPFSQAELRELIEKIIRKDELFKGKNIQVVEDQVLINLANGDGRKLCNIMDMIGNTKETTIIVNNDLVQNLVQQNIAKFDKNGELHYDIASALIKSIRGSDPNGALYWLARMIQGGESPRFIARRLVISAAEDIGLANPNALLIAQTAAQAVEFIGFPESRIILSEATIYLACSTKSNSAYTAIDEAIALVQNTGDLAVPLHLRNAPTRLMKNLDYGRDYQYAHQFKNNFIEQEYLPKEISNTTLYKPSNNPSEEKIKESLIVNWKDKYGYRA
ncbi:MAG TPA: replication-associated recombination protein A [Saprospiraceae bacterium]|nr:replication-associated recombination protein A [Saprospiraceae bacterium]